MELELVWAIPISAKDLLVIYYGLTLGRKYGTFWIYVIRCVFWSTWIERN